MGELSRYITIDPEQLNNGLLTGFIIGVVLSIVAVIIVLETMKALPKPLRILECILLTIALLFMGIWLSFLSDGIEKEYVFLIIGDFLIAVCIYIGFLFISINHTKKGQKNE